MPCQHLYEGHYSRLKPGADPGFRRGGFVHSEGGVSYIQKGGFRTGISGADPNCCRALGKSTSKTKIAGSRRGGGPITQKKPLYPRLKTYCICSLHTYSAQ